MRLHPTRHLLRILPNQRLLFHHLIWPRIALTKSHCAIPKLSRNQQRRSLFGFSPKSDVPKKETKKTDLAPGLIKMMELSTANAMRARPPPADQLQKALRDFFVFKRGGVNQNKKSRFIATTRIEADHCLATFRHLRDTITDDPNFGLSDADIDSISYALGFKLPKRDKLDLHREFALDLFAEHEKRRQGKFSVQLIRMPIMSLVRILSRAGNPAEARPYVENIWKIEKARNQYRGGEELNGTITAVIFLWVEIVTGFRFGGSEQELLRTFRLAELAGVPYVPKLRQGMVLFYAEKNDILATKAWYEKKCSIPNSPKNSGSFTLYYHILKFCLRNNEKEWCTTVFRNLVESKPTKDTWDAIFCWAASALGKGVEDLENMMAVVIRRHPDSPEVRPDTTTINRLLDMAIEQEDPYAAERYIGLGQKWGIQSNAMTYLLQMRYRTIAGDLTGAEAAYNLMRQREDHRFGDDVFVAVLNEFVQALCTAKTIKYDLINSVIEFIEECESYLTGDAVTTLCIMNLNRNELQDAINVLQVHSPHLSVPERAKTREALAEFCFDRSHDTQLVWDAYTICRHLFDEVNIEIRTRIMNEFFDRQRPDLATHVFGHMRQHKRPDKRPDLSTYVAVFSGFARPGCADADCLRIAHNMLKLDYRVEPNTKLYNSLMLAYTAVEDSYKALLFWEDITNSIEGPTYSSLEIVFRTCQITPWGDRPARNIWNKMRSMEIEVTPPVFAAYVGALAAQGLQDESKELVENMQSTMGYGPNVNILANLYNATGGQDRKNGIASWANELYPDIWMQVIALGQRADDYGERYFNFVWNTKP